MNTFGATEDIDLTDDNVDLFESLLGSKGHTSKFPKPFKTMSAVCSSASVLETLRSIQEENPQVETIFLDSDEDEEKDKIDKKLSVHNVKTVPPSPLILHGNTRSECDSDRMPVPTLTTNMPKKNLKVIEVPPSDIRLQNANALPFNIATKSFQAPRYLVIPQDVLPILAASKGPISLDIPGIGPLVIQKPSEILHAPKATVHITVNPEKSNSIILPQNKTQKSSEETEYDPLCDPKYQCWRYRRRIKRDLDGYSLLDRLGFYKAEQQRSKTCVAKCVENVKQLQYQIQMVKRKLDAIRVSKSTVDKSKTIPKKHLLKSGTKITTQIKSEVLNPIQKKNLDALISWQAHFQPPSENSSTESDDLLITKKVVILKDSKTQRGRKRKMKHTVFNTKVGSSSIGIKKQNMKMGYNAPISEDSSTESDDLLITKKVVILKDSKTQRGRKRKMKHTGFNTEDGSSSIDIKTQNMKMGDTALTSQKSARLTDRLVQKHIKRKPGRPRKSKSLMKQNKLYKHKKDMAATSLEPAVKRKMGRPKKLKVKGSSLLYDEEISPIRPCYVHLSPVKIKPEVLERYETYSHKSEHVGNEFSHEVIENLQWLQNEIDSDIPILVVNEVQCSTMNLADLCHSNNIIFPVSEISDLSTDFLTFISSYNVKFVKPDILCQYLSGKRA